MRVVTILIALFAVSVGEGKGSDLLVSIDGSLVESPSDWMLKRAELRERVESRLYGRLPPKPSSRDVDVLPLSSRFIMDGKAIETLSVMVIRKGDRSIAVRFGFVRPVADEPVPLIIKNDRWVFDLSAMPPGRKRDQYAGEKRDEEFLKIRKLAIERGFAICKFVREDLALDASNSGETGVLSLYPEYDWGAIGAWAWGYQPLLDHLLATGHFDEDLIIATGHSRGGKTALAAAIFDERIDIAAPSASGSGGTGSWFHFTEGGRRQTPELIHKNHTYWFSKSFASVVENPGFDGSALHALVAPRGLINTQGIDDGLANPRGTRMMFEDSKPVFELLGARTLPATHWRPGGHGHLLDDWKSLFDYAEAYSAKNPTPSHFNNWPESSLANP